MTAATLAGRLAPWTGLVTGPLAWAVYQQAVITLLHFDCRIGDGMAGLALGAACAALLVVAGIVSWRARAAARTPSGGFIGALGAMSAALFLFAIVLQLLAAAVLPGCGA